jgi:hypothetical protein
MKLILAFVALVGALTNVGHCAGERLIGTWIVDADRTLASLREDPGHKDEETRKLVAELSSATFTYDGELLRCVVGTGDAASSRTVSYHVLLDSQQVILIETLVPETQVKTRVKVRIDGEYIWTTSRKSGIMFAFRKKKGPNQSPEPTAMSVTPPAAQEPRQP